MRRPMWRLEHGYLRVAWRGDRSRLAREAELLRHPSEDPDPLRRAGSELVLMPPSAVLELIPLARQLSFVDHGVLDAAAERLPSTRRPASASSGHPCPRGWQRTTPRRGR